ncbi:hypothetical protein [Lysinibacillus sphaericus]|uniref:Uncharacterized protein n=1 Tax=Lysinibacillus sphaericus OT4b.31 TaxID=1285586 RepID=R7ZDL8_LYSSH|nr:hypothetical protein [Lysinibacillus sphaericus]EON72245.1 hypothetical protein H131_11738 [Lysinibacillus sphaericus OT4b.31]
MANNKGTVEISIIYKNGVRDSFSIPANEAHAQKLVGIGAEIGGHEGESSFIALTNKDTDECLFVNLGEVRSVHLKTVVTE